MGLVTKTDDPQTLYHRHHHLHYHVYEENFAFREHVERMVTQSNQGLYAIRTLRARRAQWHPSVECYQGYHCGKNDICQTITGGVCLMRAVGSAYKLSSLKCRHTHSRHIFQFTVDIHFQNTLLVHLSMLLCSLLLPKLRRSVLCAFIYRYSTW